MSKNQPVPLYDVIISGAGPVGLFLAGELALAKCSVLVLEKAENPSSPLKQLPFGIRGLSAPSIEAFDRRGLLEKLDLHKRMSSPHKHAGEGSKRQVGHFAGIPFHAGDIDISRWPFRLPTSTETSLISEMQEIETALTQRAESAGVEIRRGAAVTYFNQTEEDVTVRTGEISFRGKWLVGCDGSRSVVRKLGGFEFAGTEPEFTGYTTQLEIADPEKLKPGRNVTERGMYMQSQPGYVMMQDFDGGAFHGSDKTVTLEHIQELLRRISGTDVRVTTLHIATTWTDRARQATEYRKGRVLLAGDAAHIHSPLGGQGLNLGLGDAMNLGWKLAATIHHTAAEDLLDSYYNERFPIGVNVLNWSRAQVLIMKPDPNSQALYAILRDLMNTTDGATYLAGRVWSMNLHYDFGGDHPLMGHSVPNVQFEDGTTIGEIMRDGKGILLDFNATPSLKKLAAEYGDALKYVSGNVKESFGLHALLIRPDGYVAGVFDADTDEQIVRQKTDRWFMRTVKSI